MRLTSISQNRILHALRAEIPTIKAIEVLKNPKLENQSKAAPRTYEKIFTSFRS
ncbi:MAG TPA: hypothetical protein VLU95_03210 [Candidatus Acidoferrum sp.]|nr:hypothetical protein [Candidatus Acidoferrum sp.]